MGGWTSEFEKLSSPVIKAASASGKEGRPWGGALGGGRPGAGSWSERSLIAMFPPVVDFPLKGSSSGREAAVGKEYPEGDSLLNKSSLMGGEAIARWPPKSNLPLNWERYTHSPGQVVEKLSGISSSDKGIGWSLRRR